MAFLTLAVIIISVSEPNVEIIHVGMLFCVINYCAVGNITGFFVRHTEICIVNALCTLKYSALAVC